METPFLPQTDLENMGSEVRSYIYQTILEFEPFSTPDTTVTVVAKDPLKLLNEEHEERSSDQLRRMWRIAISLSEDGTQIEEEGVHEDIYMAINMAKDKLIKALSEIQNDVISTQDRMVQIQNALAGHQLH